MLVIYSLNLVFLMIWWIFADPFLNQFLACFVIECTSFTEVWQIIFTIVASFVRYIVDFSVRINLLIRREIEEIALFASMLTFKSIANFKINFKSSINFFGSNKLSKYDYNFFYFTEDFLSVYFRNGWNGGIPRGCHNHLISIYIVKLLFKFFQWMKKIFKL